MQTVTGFGYAIIAAPLMALVLGAKETVMIVMITAFFISVFLMRATRNQGSFKSIMPLIISSVAGAIPGAFVMTLISNDGLKLFIGTLLLIVTTALWRNYTFPVRHNQSVELLVGFISGFLTTTTGITGPPVILYYLNSKAEENKLQFRANLTRFFLIIYSVSAIISFAAGTLRMDEIWHYLLLSIPALFIGFIAGEKMFDRIGAADLRTGCLIMVIVSSLAIIWSVLLKSH